jgi:hypothetical protein
LANAQCIFFKSAAGQNQTAALSAFAQLLGDGNGPARDLTAADLRPIGALLKQSIAIGAGFSPTMLAIETLEAPPVISDFRWGTEIHPIHRSVHF